ncbi:small secreted protein [Streptomyces sp. NBC_01537]|uniref:small secreted protein n=1 Tax=Streptomyces sp. NBC_01537 TaxID=2903896 RepID=UPI00386D54B9
MTNKFTAALTGAALVLALGSLSACGDDGNKELDSWAKTVCDQAAAQVTKINDANTAITKVDSAGKPLDVRRADSAAFAQISAAYASLAGIVNQAGDPPVDKGAALKKDAVSDLTKLSVSYAALQKQVDALNIADQAKFAAGLKTVSESLAKVSKSGEQALDTLRQGELGTAMAKQPGCQQGGTVSPSVSAS